MCTKISARRVPHVRHEYKPTITTELHASYLGLVHIECGGFNIFKEANPSLTWSSGAIERHKKKIIKSVYFDIN